MERILIIAFLLMPGMTRTEPPPLIKISDLYSLQSKKFAFEVCDEPEDEPEEIYEYYTFPPEQDSAMFKVKFWIKEYKLTLFE